MNRSEFVFKAIDILGYLPENSEKFSGITSVKDIKYSNKGNGSLTSGDLYFKTDFIGDGNTYAAMVPQVAHPFGVGIIHNVFVAYAGNIRRPKAVIAVPGGH